MELINFTKILEEIYYPEVKVLPANYTVEISEELTIINGNKLLFNDFESNVFYKDFCWNLLESVKKDIVDNFITSKTRVKVLFDIKQIKTELLNVENFIITYKHNNLNDVHKMFYEHSIERNIPLADELRNANFSDLNSNKYIKYSEELKELINEDNIKEVEKFIHSFISTQIILFGELVSTIELYESFIENISSEEFKNKEVLNELSFIRNVIPEFEKNKVFTHGNLKEIRTLDIKQVALFYDYLEKAKLIIQYKYKKDKAFLAHHLTGYSEHNLRAKEGFPFIDAIKEDRKGHVHKKNKKDIDFFNLKTVREQIANVIKLVDKDIERLSIKKNESHP